MMPTLKLLFAGSLLVLLLCSHAQAQTLYQIDSGVNLDGVTHGPDFTGGNGRDCHGHGTAMATISGIPATAIISVRVLNCAGVGNYVWTLEAIDWVRARAQQGDMVLLALGFGPVAPGDWTGWDDAINDSLDRGVSWVIAAGNSNDWTFNYSPARVWRAIIVAAASGLDKAPYSNFGPSVTLFSEGCALGWCGTSVASATIAGTVYGMLQQMPWAPPGHIKNNLTCAAWMVNPGPGTTSCKR